MTARQLPWELLEHVFKVEVGGEPVLSPIDRVRCLAVCRLWRRVLDPRRFPLQSVGLPISDSAKASQVLEWVLQKLVLEIHTGPVGQFWPTICQFLSLRELCLWFNSPVVLDTSMLRSLPPLLVNLDVSMADLYIQGSSGLLTALTRLRAGFGSTLEVNAALPSLAVLNIEDMNSVQLVGDQLQLPRLRTMQLDCSKGTVDFHSMPALWELHSYGWGPDAWVGLAALPNLAILKLPSMWPGFQEFAASILQQAPAILRALQLTFHRRCLERPAADMAAKLGPALGRFPRLEYFVCDSTDFLPCLRRLPGLRGLEFRGMTAADISIQDADHLASSMFSLAALIFQNELPPGEARDMRLKVLGRILPEGCQIFQP
ncbi:hypothetical protein N2152v2_004465 [Parachlorella kessleri]